MKRGIARKLAFALLPLSFSFLIVFLLFGSSSALSSSAAPPVATEDKALEYGIICAQFGVPWEIVLLTDAMRAYSLGLSGIEDYNPAETALEFVIIAEKQEHWEVVGQETHIAYVPSEDGTELVPVEEVVDVYDWVHLQTIAHIGKSSIQNYLHLSNLDGLTAKTMVETSAEITEEKNTEEYRYTAFCYYNSNYQEVLCDRLGMTLEECEEVLTLHDVHYMERYVSEDILAQINAVQAEYGLLPDDWESWITDNGGIDADFEFGGGMFSWPLPGHTYISSPFHAVREGVGSTKPHSGIDIPAAEGTPIYAAADGIVLTNGHWSYGICVKLVHGSNIVTVYGHMSSRAPGIRDGVSVSAGDLIGYVGHTGNATGDHLHFEIDVNGVNTDPAQFGLPNGN